MTIIVGLKCVDGAIIASDSQQEFGRGVAVKRINVSKIYTFEDKCAIAGAGTLAHIEKAVDAVKTGLNTAKKRKGGLDLTEDECTNAIEKSITAVYKEYNIERAKFLGESRESNFFRPILILGGLVKVDDKNKPCVSIIHSKGLVENIVDYATAGSGAAYAELILKELYSEKITIKEGIAAAIYTIDAVKEIDPNCGGVTNVSIVNPNKGVQELSTEEVTNLFNKVKPILDLVRKEITPKILKGELDERKLKSVLEKHEG